MTIGDITKTEDCERIVAKTIEYFGRIDVLVNNAGIIKPSNFENSTIEMLDQTFDVNVHGMIRMTRAAIQSLQGHKGCIVNISSFISYRPINDYITYCLSKTAVEQFTKNLALDLGQIGIRVNSVCPAIMGDTEFWTRPGLPLNKNPLFGGMIMKKICSMYPMQRSGLTKEVIPSIIFLISDKCSSFMTGSSLVVDGGKSMTSAQP
ncbi:hypothetical protein LSH36_1517g00028 [Paralvinella palmiformis]|uniref:Uncharacterized protein n=1 Tax=Paralvinella palmiformis TaxID=53620 RepID=A0AAD9ISZ1_9ANNE|nr:hypothetical protein LSH36_1517g00028 [Paralvinella palmiformis]